MKNWGMPLEPIDASTFFLISISAFSSLSATFPL
jgi:hypothetical protein